MEKHSSSPSASEVVSTDSFVTVFMEILVDPLLHLYPKRVPTVEEQSSLAKQVLMRVEQEQRLTQDARRFAEKDAEAQKYVAQVLQEKLEASTSSLATAKKV